MSVTKHNFSFVFSEAWIKALSEISYLAFALLVCIHQTVMPIRYQTKVCQILPARVVWRYIPLYTPAKRRISGSQDTFSTGEHKVFEACYESESYSENLRYQVWLALYHPDEAVSFTSDVQASFETVHSRQVPRLSRNLHATVPHLLTVVLYECLQVLKTCKELRNERKR